MVSDSIGLIVLKNNLEDTHAAKAMFFRILREQIAKFCSLTLSQGVKKKGTKAVFPLLDSITYQAVVMFSMYQLSIHPWNNIKSEKTEPSSPSLA